MGTRRAQLLTAGALILGTALIGIGARRTGATSGGAAGGATFAARDGSIEFRGTLDRTAVLRGRDGTVRLELVMKSAPAPDRGRVRIPTDLVVVLDRSGSMDGDKIVDARAAVVELVAALAPEDRFALVTYSDDAALSISLDAATDEAKRIWRSRVAEVMPGGGTNMSSGLDLALDTIERARASGRGARAILISDGLANQGDPTAEGLARRAARAARSEYPLSTVGVGADFNEQLMTSLADAGTGNYYYLRGSDDLAQVFAREFGAARETVASGLAVRIDPASGVEVVDVAGYPLERRGGTVTFRPGSLFAGQERRVWVTLTVPHDTVGERPVGTFALDYGAGGQRRTIALQETPRVACVEAEKEYFAKVDVPAWTRSVLVDQYNQMQSGVAASVREGRKDEAIQQLRQFKEEAKSMNARLRSAPVAARIAAADELERDVAAAFDGENQPAKQNEFGKAKAAAALDGRRAGSKKTEEGR